MEIQYVIGDATQPLGTGPRVIVHLCNDIGAWGQGFVLALSERWPGPERRYREWYEPQSPEPLPLGQVQFVDVDRDLWVANLIGQHGLRPQGGTPPIRYDALREGLALIAIFAEKNQATVHMPRIGSGLAGGDWEEISRIIGDELIAQGIPVTVYSLTK